MPMRQDCKQFESRTYPDGETVRKCNLDLAPDAPWRCPDPCPGYEPRLADVHWGHGRLIMPRTPEEPPGLEDGSAAAVLDEESVSDTFPYMEVGARDAVIGHEATVSKVADEQLFYLMSRGLSAEQAMGMIVNGFIEPVTRTLPMEYAVEWSRLIELQMEGSVG